MSQLNDNDQRAAFCDGLEQIAAFLREHPEVPLPSIGSYPYPGAAYEPTLTAWATHDRSDTRTQRQIMADTARAFGKAEKSPWLDDSQFVLYRKFAGIWFVLQADRDEVCERVVTGTREVTETVPDPEALAAVPTVEVTKTVEDVEWVCRPLLGDREPAEAGA
jgi:hypothetical protein